MFVFLSLLAAASAEECEHSADCANAVSLLTLRSAASYRAAQEMWTLISQIRAMATSAVEQEIEIAEWSAENSGLKEAVLEMRTQDGAASVSPSVQPQAATAQDPTVIPGINDMDTDFSMEEGHKL